MTDAPSNPTGEDGRPAEQPAPPSREAPTPTWQPESGQQPGWQPPGQGQPPGWQQPGQGQPPGWQQPSYGQQPGYGQPPVWGQPPGYGPGFGGGAPKPGVIPLRPLGVGEILDGAFTTMRRHPKATFGLAAAVAAVGAIAQLLVMLPLRGRSAVLTTTGNDIEVGDITGFLAAIVVAALVSGLAQLLLTGMLTVVVGEGVLGRRVEVGDVWRRAFKRFWALLGVSMLSFLIVVLIFVVAVVIAVVTWAITPAIGVLAIFAAAGVALWAGVKLSLSTPALILEGQSVTGALRRSWALVTGSWWRVFGILLLAILVAGVISEIIQIPFGLGQPSPFNFDQTVEETELTTGSIILAALGTFVAGAVTGPVVALISALLYVDRRIRAEGFDLTLAMAARGEPGAPSGAGGPPPAGDTPGQYGGTPPDYFGNSPGSYGGGADRR